MKNKISIIILVVLASLTRFSGNAQTNVVAATQFSNCQTQFVTLSTISKGILSYQLSTNQIVILNGFSYNANVPALRATFPNNYSCDFTVPTTFTGATSMYIYNLAGGYFPLVASVTILTPSTNGITVIPANSVVIPSDATGNVQIILQSSSDLVNWIPSLPGTYGSTYSNRFFRVIAVAQ
jgi:hypothetical protein